MYDIIGDIHGHFTQLKLLLKKLGYLKNNGFYSHPEKQAIFVGDLVNRGPDSRKTIKLVRRMVENKAALCVLGNHDYHLICYFTKVSPGRFLIQHNSHNRTAIAATIKSYTGKEDRLTGDIEWLRMQPLLLNLENLRVVHACWDKNLINFLNYNYPKHLSDDEFLRKSVIQGSKEMLLIEVLLSGRKLDPGKQFGVTNSLGKPAHEMQVKWWMNPAGKTLKDVAFGAYKFHRNRLLTENEMKVFSEYPPDKKPLFIGHYCLSGYSGILQENICNMDFCCYRTGRLAAYRWSGERKLLVKNVVSI